MVEHVLAVVVVAQHVGGHVPEDRLLAQIEADHLRHVRILRLVVGDSRADGVGERHAPGAISGEQPRHAEHRIGAESEGIEEVVVDAPVDDVDLLRALGRAHEYRIVDHDEVGALDQLDAHLLREERMLEIGAVVVAGREQHDDGILDATLRHGAQRLEQQVGIVVDGTDALLREELGEEPHHHLAVLEHVRHARGRAQVVLEHVVRAVLMAHEIDAGDVRIHVVRQLQAEHRDLVGLVGEHLLGRHHALFQDLLFVIDVVQEAVQRVAALVGRMNDPAGVAEAADQARTLLDPIVSPVESLRWNERDIRAFMRALADEQEFVRRSDVHSAEQIALTLQSLAAVLTRHDPRLLRSAMMKSIDDLFAELQHSDAYDANRFAAGLQAVKRAVNE